MVPVHIAGVPVDGLCVGVAVRAADRHANVHSDADRHADADSCASHGNVYACADPHADSG